jgi:hypothetical protein
VKQILDVRLSTARDLPDLNQSAVQSPLPHHTCSRRNAVVANIHNDIRAHRFWLSYTLIGLQKNVKKWSGSSGKRQSFADRETAHGVSLKCALLYYLRREDVNGFSA